MINKENLSEAQWAAVEYCDGPSLVIAGAGSGKTRVLTYKIAYLLDQGLPPWSILALTFTNKAAREMQERIGKQVGAELASGLWMGTFHSIFARILRIECAHIGFASNFTIYDATDSLSLIRSIIREMKLDDKQYKPSAVAARISIAKNALLLPTDYERNSHYLMRDGAKGMGKMVDIYRTYRQRCQQANAMDFDDLLLYTWILFKDHEEIRQKYQERFQFVLVDEYQDTNFAQHQIVWQLTRERQRVCVVGDDAQSIYSFRGANIDNILNFQQMYSTSRLFKLEQNYRSTQNIVSAANSLIHHNQRQIHKDVFSQNNIGERIVVTQAYSDTDEANIIVRNAKRIMRNEHIPYNQMVVLYRTHSQSRSFEEALRREGLPYRIYGGTSFYQRKEVKDVIAYFRLSLNQNDEEAFKRIINYPARGIGQTTLEKILAKAYSDGISLWEVISHPESLDINSGTRSRLIAFRELIDSFHQQVDTLDAYTIALQIVRESGVRDDIFKSTETEDISKQENLQELLDGISAFVQEKTEEGSGILMAHYLQEVSLLSDLDVDKGNDDDKLTLMTIHSAKGLEFDVVFVVGMEESLFPNVLSFDSPRQLEEERRLFYVAMTRVRTHLFLTYAKSRIRYGSFEYSRPSRFLSEIDSRYLQVGNKREDVPVARPDKTRVNLRMQQPIVERKPVSSTPPPRFVPVRPSAATSSAPSPATANLKVGSKVEHDRFGRGVVARIDGQGIDAKATVNFQNAGTKILLLRFARLSVVED